MSLYFCLTSDIEHSNRVHTCRRKGQLTTAEHRERGALKSSVYFQYIAAMGGGEVAVMTAALLAGQAAWIMSEWWLAQWSGSSPTEQQSNLAWWLGWYCALVAGAAAAAAALMPAIVVLHLRHSVKVKF